MENWVKNRLAHKLNLLIETASLIKSMMTMLQNILKWIMVKFVIKLKKN